MSSRSIALAGIGFGALAVATAGFVVDVPPQVVEDQHHGFIVYESFDNAVATQGQALTAETTEETAVATTTVLCSAAASESEVSIAKGIVAVDKKRIAILDDEIAFFL